MPSLLRGCLMAVVAVTWLGVIGGLGAVTAQPIEFQCVRWSEEDERSAGAATRSEQKPAGAIPVVVHLMLAQIPDSDRPPLDTSDGFMVVAPRGRSVKGEWGKEKLRRFFSHQADAGEPGLVSIWREHRVEFWLERIEDCPYDPTQVRGDHKVRDSVVTPDASPQDFPWAKAFFPRVNNGFTQREPRTVHVLLWWSIGEATLWTGFARSQAHGGPAAWIDIKCVLIPPGESRRKMEDPDCARLIAHEFGHVLELCHVCRSAIAGTPLPGVCPVPPPCDDLGPENLMRDDHNGTTLTSEDQQKARRAASKLLSP